MDLVEYDGYRESFYVMGVVQICRCGSLSEIMTDIGQPDIEN